MLVIMTLVRLIARRQKILTFKLHEIWLVFSEPSHSL